MQSIERRLAQMRLRQVKQRQVLRDRESRRQEKEKDLLARQIEREHFEREKPAFKKIANYLFRSERRMRLERYVTAMYGCRTSWPRIQAHAIYAVVAERRNP